jgi:hypothetical protein
MTSHPAKPLNTCDETGLRDAIANASSGDILDLTACSEITLTTGEVHVNVDDLTLNGPGADQLAIKGGYYGRIFDHTGIGTLSINNMTLTHTQYLSYLGGVAMGGCIYSAGSVALTDAMVTGCYLDAALTYDYALGGAIYARNDVTLVGGGVTDNTAYSPANEAAGGGIFARGNFSATDATIANNTVIAPSSYAIGGGVVVLGAGDVEIVGSTLSGNAAQVAGGVYVNTTGSTKVVNSTITSNYASQYVGGASFVSGATLVNSTVTANAAQYALFGVGVYAAYQLTLQSSILANNLDSAGTTMADAVAGTIVGADNLITAASTATPDGTITACPRLTPLQDNGGPTLTHRLIAGSPAIDVGNNTIPVDTDQRSIGFVRTFGPKTDIGAVEWQGELDDSVFRSAFEVRCD